MSPLRKAAAVSQTVCRIRSTRTLLASRPAYLLLIYLRGRYCRRTRMRCHDCLRELTIEEPVCRIRRPRYGTPAWTSVCAGCLASGTDSIRKWLPPRPCLHCSRPVIADRRRKGIKFVVCSPEGRNAVYNRERPRLRICDACGQQFLLKRSDGKFCSVACQQRAYQSNRRAR